MPMQISISNSIGGGGGNLGSGGGGAPFESTKSFDFDGNTDFITMGDGTLEFNRTSTFSISCWFKPEQAEVSAIISKSYFTGPLQGYMIWQQAHGANVKVNCRLRKSSSEHVQFQGSDVLTKNQWHHIVMTYNGSGNNTGLKMYFNGTEGSGTRTGTMSEDIDWTSHSIPFNLGARMNGNIPFNGIIDEVGVFDSELSSSNVTSIYNSGVPNDLASLSPVSWWRMGEAANYAGATWTLTDQGSGGNDGTSTTLPAPPAAPSTNVPT